MNPITEDVLREMQIIAESAARSHRNMARLRGWACEAISVEDDGSYAASKVQELVDVEGVDPCEIASDLLRWQAGIEDRGAGS